MIAYTKSRLLVYRFYMVDDGTKQNVAPPFKKTLSNKKNSNQELQLIASKVYCFRQKKL